MVCPRFCREGHPGLLAPSVRYPAGENYAVLNPAALSDPRLNCQLAYRRNGQRIAVESTSGRTWFVIPLAQLQAGCPSPSRADVRRAPESVRFRPTASIGLEDVTMPHPAKHFAA